MRKKNHHTFFGLPHVLLLVMLALTNLCHAQEDVVVPAEESTDTLKYFDTVSAKSLLPLTLRKIPDTTAERIRKDEDYWYANKAPEKKAKAKEKEEEPVNEPGSNSLLQSILWFVIIGAFIAVVIWYLASSNIRLFRRRLTLVETQQDELPAEDIFSMNFQKEIDQAIADGNFRLAVRLLYLGTLKDLSDRGIIQYTHEKTNSDYLFSLSGSRYYKDFFRLTREFEYTWYGAFALSPEAFEIVKKDFISFKQQLQ